MEKQPLPDLTTARSGLQYYRLSKYMLEEPHYLGSLFQAGACVGLYFINRPEWLVVDHACSAYSYVSVPLYDTLGLDAVKYIINHANLQAVFCEPSTLYIIQKKLLSFLSEINSIRIIVVVGGTYLPSLPATSGVHEPFLRATNALRRRRILEQNEKALSNFYHIQNLSVRLGINSMETVARGRVRILDPDELVCGEEIGPNW
ncbi:hypothetical protein L6452_22041 [Arctium lappa]|uniref:Uncharacterized protein n=1 Tax=Arctium lappa TaxID=4217 RepID=A0ACB9AZJ5_ARCLA|nr:hypothetical protein L6452_22041 [Arctium lappa]